MSLMAGGVAALCAAVFTVASTGGSAAAASVASPWLQTGYSAALTYANPNESILSTANVTELRPALKLHGNSGDNLCESGGFNSAVASDSRFYTTSGGVLTAWTTSGHQIWKTIAPKADVDTDLDDLQVSHGLVIVTQVECDYDDAHAAEPGTVRAYNSQTGSLAWSHPFVSVPEYVQVSGQYVATGANPDAGSPAQTAVLRISDGSTKWATHRSCGAQPGIVHGLVFANYCAKSGDELRALSLSTGATVWTRSGDLLVFSGDSDTTSAHHLYASTDNGTHVVDLNPGTGRTRFTLPGSYATTLAVDHTRVYADCDYNQTTFDTKVCAYDLATGKRLWTYAQNFVLGAVEANGVLYLSTGDILNAATGRRVSHIGDTPLLVAQGRLLATDSDANLTVFSR